MALGKIVVGLFEVHISKHSPLRLKITVGCLVCGVVCFVCARGACGVWVVCVHVVLCVVLVVCSCVLVSGGGGGVVCCVGVVWMLCGVFFVFVLRSFSFFCQFSFPLSCSLSFFLLSSLLLLSSLPLFRSLFSSRHQTLRKEPINQHGGQLRGI